MSSAVQSQGHFSFCASHTVLPVRSLGEYKLLGADREKTDDLNWSNGCSISYGIMSKNYKMVGSWPEVGAATAWVLAGHQSAGCASLVL